MLTPTSSSSVNPTASASPVPRGFPPPSVDGSKWRVPTPPPPGSIPSPAEPRTRPTPLAKRPKGQFFVGASLLVICGTAASLVWNAYFRFEARGVVNGRIVRVSTPWASVVRAVHVRENEEVRQGQLLVTFGNFDHEQRLAQVMDQLRVAQAELESQVSQLRWQAQQQGDRAQKAVSEYYELWGQLLEERARLKKATADVEHLNAARGEHSLAVSERQLESAQILEAGQRAKVEKLDDAVKELARRVKIYHEDQEDGSAQFRPYVLRIESLEAELVRLREQIRQGEVRAPVSGRVVRVHHFTGEHAEPAEPTVELVEQGSLEAVVYMPQDRVGTLETGDKLLLVVAPSSRRIECQVTRFGGQFEHAPASIERHYDRNARLLPVHLQPVSPGGLEGVLGGEVQVPCRWGAS